MLGKIIYLTLWGMILSIRNGFCDPVTDIVMAIGASLAGAGATLGPAGVLAAGGLGLSAASMLNSPGKVNQPGQPAAPDPNAAAETALTEQTIARQALLLSGGQTTLTGPGGAPLLGPDLGSKSLIGT